MTKTGLMMTVRETAAWLRERDEILILTHKRPDGDAIGSAAALADGLRAIGKTVFLLYNPETTQRYIKYAENYWAPEGFKPCYTITVDTASLPMLQVNASEYEQTISLSIDHHPSNSQYAANQCHDSACAACGEIVYDILIELSGRITQNAAACIYVALSTDTGCFAFANTTANTLRVAALAIEAGAPHREINRRLFRTKTKSRIKIEGMINSGLEFFYGGTVAIASITKAMRDETGANEEDMDDISSIPGSVEGVLVGITVRELSSERDCKVSVRTSPRVSADALCARFGGGGHPMAAGFSAELTISEIKERLIEALSEIFPLKDEK